MRTFFDRSPIKIFALQTCLVLGTLLLSNCSSREEQAQSYYDHGKSYLDKHDYIKARVELRNALQKKPDMVAAWRALATIDEHDKNIQSLATSLRNIVERDAKDVDARVQLAKIYLLGGALENALKTTNEAIEIARQNAAVLASKPSFCSD